MPEQQGKALGLQRQRRTRTESEAPDTGKCASLEQSKKRAWFCVGQPRRQPTGTWRPHLTLDSIGWSTKLAASLYTARVTETPGSVADPLLCSSSQRKQGRRSGGVLPRVLFLLPIARNRRIAKQSPGSMQELRLGALTELGQGNYPADAKQRTS